MTEELNTALLAIGTFLVVYGITWYWAREYISKSTTNNNSLTHYKKEKAILSSFTHRGNIDTSLEKLEHIIRLSKWREYISKPTTNNNSLTHSNTIKECDNCGSHYDTKEWPTCPYCERIHKYSGV